MAQQSWREGPVSPAHSPSLLSHPCFPFPLSSPAGKDWQQQSLGPTTSAAPPPEGLAVALCRLRDPFTACFPMQHSLFAVLVWFPLSLPHLCPQHVPPLALAPGLGVGRPSAVSGRGSRAAVSRVVLGWDSPGGTGSGAGASFLPSRPGEARGAGMSWLHTLVLALCCRRGVSGSAGSASPAVLETWRAQSWLLRERRGRMGPGWAAA